nr:GIY-YIG nuclease family protein [uncultured Glaciecola sp.]
MNQKNSDKPWFIYLIKNKLNQLYCGITVDVQRRFLEHASNSTKCAKALKGKGPLVIMFCARVGNQSEALKLEHWLKKQTRQHKDKLIAGTSALPVEHELLGSRIIQANINRQISQQ